MILQQVTSQLNKTYRIFKEFNPEFDGKVHLVGHSLGSMILFDILSKQKKYELEFQVDNLFFIGSPIGLLKLIQRTKIGDRPEFPNDLERKLTVQRTRNVRTFIMFTTSVIPFLIGWNLLLVKKWLITNKLIYHIVVKLMD